MSRFALQVPLDTRYRGLAAEIAGKYADVVGATPADAAALAEAVAAAIAAVGAHAPADAEVHLDFAPGAAGLSVTIRCHGHQKTITHSLPAPRR